jgi:hypothetical protein
MNSESDEIMVRADLPLRQKKRDKNVYRKEFQTVQLKTA